ncbi:alpha/beta hydrolase [Lentzea alba]|uniref:alpha/beta hydrolase family protein n=1 Tax=Lentzea alba TaxID=2714351 RepID=UPI0039BF6838
MSVVELTTFTVKPGSTTAMLAARPGMLDAFRRDRRGFLSARLIRLSDDTWLDAVEWIDDTAWDESKLKGANQPEIATFFGTIAAVVSSERGARYDDPADRAVRTIAYGPHPSQVGELYLPAGEGPFPVIVLVHGGYWTALWDRRGTTRLADALVGEGYAVWNVEYRRLGEEGGGWPGTFDDVAAAVDAVADPHPALDLSRVQVVGHSAGGQLAVWAAGRTDAKVQFLSAVSIAELLDVVTADAGKAGAELADPDAPPPADAPEAARPELGPVIAALAGEGMPHALFGGHREDVPDRYARAVQPLTVPLLQILGENDDVIPLEHAGHPSAELRRIPDANHFDVVDPNHSTWPVIRDWLAGQWRHADV